MVLQYLIERIRKNVLILNNVILENCKILCFNNKK